MELPLIDVRGFADASWHPARDGACSISEVSPARDRSIHWGEFRAGRAAGDYADSGEEIQISQFRI